MRRVGYLSVLLALLPMSLWGKEENREPVVTNPLAKQLDYEHVLVTYDVEDGDGDLMTVSIKVSYDGGKTFGFTAPSEQLSGDVGGGISSGKGKEIVWSIAVDEFLHVYGENYVIRVLADDGVKVETVVGHTPPQIPRDLSSRYRSRLNGKYDVALMWEANTEKDLKGYQIYSTKSDEKPVSRGGELAPRRFLQRMETSIVLENEGWLINERKQLVPKVYYVSAVVKVNTTHPDTGLPDESMLAVAPPPPGFEEMLFDFLTLASQSTITPPASNEDNVKSNWLAIKSQMTLIPAGSFEMGDSKNETDGYMRRSRPVHTVQLDAFYMDVHEVTVGQFREFVNQSGYKYGGNWAVVAKYSPGDGYPMVCVSWNDATAYAEWAGKRLPTEAEWEYAARGGLVGKRYSRGDEIDRTKAHYDGWNGGRGTTKNVGSFEANGYGLYDMAGNVREWCQDRYEENYYSRSPAKNPPGPDTGSRRVLRGGSWSNAASTLRVGRPLLLQSV